MLGGRVGVFCGWGGFGFFCGWFFFVAVVVLFGLGFFDRLFGDFFGCVVLGFFFSD